MEVMSIDPSLSTGFVSIIRILCCRVSCSMCCIMCCSEFRTACGSMCCSVLQCVAVCCSVLQCVAVQAHWMRVADDYPVVHIVLYSYVCMWVGKIVCACVYRVAYNHKVPYLYRSLSAKEPYDECFFCRK